jgi:hypothetical protein
MLFCVDFVKSIEVWNVISGRQATTELVQFGDAKYSFHLGKIQITIL